MLVLASVLVLVLLLVLVARSWFFWPFSLLPLRLLLCRFVGAPLTFAVALGCRARSGPCVDHVADHNALGTKISASSVALGCRAQSGSCAVHLLRYKTAPETKIDCPQWLPCGGKLSTLYSVFFLFKLFVSHFLVRVSFWPSRVWRAVRTQGAKRRTPNER